MEQPKASLIRKEEASRKTFTGNNKIGGQNGIPI